MKKILLTATVASIALSGCATNSVGTFEPFRAKDLTSLIGSGHLKQKANTFFVINDSSSSMSEMYSGSGFSSDATKLAIEKEILTRFNNALPNITLSSGLRSFGYGPCLSWGYTHLNQSIQSHSPSSFEGAVNSLECSSGGTPAASAFEAASVDLASASGQISVIFLSDGHNYDSSPATAIEALQEQYGDNFCLHTIWVGNEAEGNGQAVLQELAEISGCGSSVAASAVASSEGMANFISTALFDSATPHVVAIAGDADGDGVQDSKDKCPNTPKGAKVDRDGCWAFHGIFFDFDQSKIKPGYENTFNSAAKVLTLNPALTVEIQGHTDSIGSEAYNLGLSTKRAEAVKQHMVKKGINPSRMTTKGFGESKPVASNRTSDGRAHNRRVFYKRTDLK